MLKLLPVAILLMVAPAGAAETGIASTFVDTVVGCPGEKFTAAALVAAHKTLPCGSSAEVYNKATGLRTTVKIIDRGPFRDGRIIDLSPAAAAAIGSNGLATVIVTPIPHNRPETAQGEFSGFALLWRTRIGF